MSEPLEPRPKTRARRTVLIAAVALLLAASGGVVVWWNSVDQATCAAGAMACGPCCEGDVWGGPVEPEDPETVQFPDAVDLTAGSELTSVADYVNIAAGVWVSDPKPKGWMPVPNSALDDVMLGYEQDGSHLYCYAAGQRAIAIADFLDDEGVFASIAVAQRARYDEVSAYERTGDTAFGHYRVDGNAVLAAEAEYIWTKAVDPETGETREGEWTETWGFVAVYRGSAGAAICSYGGPTDAEALDGLQEHLLGLRLTD
ncbi:hypothetical protein [Glycomyces sp. NPDC048151]|uniref:hypothetical protein n=1 Tax=Glycomyces sp. NPDC048151 TaxID=3364002 RepID=UPI00371654BE